MTDRAIVVVGAGSVGLTAGVRLAAAGRQVRFVTRSASAAEAIGRDDVRVEDPGSGEIVRARARAFTGLASAAAAGPADVVLLCVRATDTEAIAPELARAFPGAPIACVQNDVDNEAIVARATACARNDVQDEAIVARATACARNDVEDEGGVARAAARVLGVVWRQTCTRFEPNAVRALGRGRVVVGLHPEGSAPEADDLAADFRAAGFDVGVSLRIVEDKWLKLCVNLMSAPNALVRPEDHETRAFVETKARLLEEARDVLGAAGIPARSCDGRDRSLDEEIAFQRESLARGASARRLPVYNQIWAALRERRALEGDRYHRRIVALGARAGVPTPMNERVLRALERAFREGHGPESLGAEELLGAG